MTRCTVWTSAWAVPTVTPFTWRIAGSISALGRVVDSPVQLPLSATATGFDTSIGSPVVLGVGRRGGIVGLRHPRGLCGAGTGLGGAAAWREAGGRRAAEEGGGRGAAMLAHCGGRENAGHPRPLPLHPKHPADRHDCD